MSKYLVIISGVRPDVDTSQVVKKLSVILKSDEKKIRALLVKAPFKVKSGLNLEQARKIKSALQKTGAKCQIKEIPPKDRKKTPEPVGLQMENPEVDAVHGGSAVEPLDSCPSCGYEAHSDTDPLLTAHGGLGECPKCGVIRQRLKKNPLKGSWESAGGEVEQEISKRPPTWMIATIGVMAIALLVVVGLLVFGSKPEPQTAEGGNSTKTSMATAADDGESNQEPAGDEEATESELVCVLPVNSSETITLSGYAPIFHDAEVWQDIKGDFEIYNNYLKSAGLEIGINMVIYDRETFPMPNVQVKDNIIFSVFGRKNSRQLEIRPVHWWHDNKKSSSTVFMANDVYSILDMRNMDEIEYLDKMKSIANNPERVVWRDFTVYPVNIDLRFDVPDGESLKKWFRYSRNPSSALISLSLKSLSLTKDGKTADLNVVKGSYKFSMLASPVWEDQDVVGLKIEPSGVSIVYDTISCPGLEMQ